MNGRCIGRNGSVLIGIRILASTIERDGGVVAEDIENSRLNVNRKCA